MPLSTCHLIPWHLPRPPDEPMRGRPAGSRATRPGSHIYPQPCQMRTGEDNREPPAMARTLGTMACVNRQRVAPDRRVGTETLVLQALWCRHSCRISRHRCYRSARPWGVMSDQKSPDGGFPRRTPGPWPGWSGGRCPAALCALTPVKVGHLRQHSLGPQTSTCHKPPTARSPLSAVHRNSAMG